MLIDSEFWKRYTEYAMQEQAKRVRSHRPSETPLCSGIVVPGRDPEDAEKIISLIQTRQCTAFITPLCMIEQMGIVIPKTGDLRIVIDGNAVERCVIRSEKPMIVSWRDITSEQAMREGTDPSFWAWQKRTRQQLQTICGAEKRSFQTDEMMLLDTFRLEYFES